jgi:hypothetical protein
MDTASSQVKVFSICLFSPQTDDEQKQIKNTWPVKMWYSGSLCGLSISPSWLKSLMNFHFIFSYPDYSKPDLIASYIYCQGYKPGRNMEFGHCWYMKSVFCNILQIWILYTYMYYIHMLILLLWKWAIHKTLFSISACIPNIKEKRKNINVRKMFTSYQSYFSN